MNPRRWQNVAKYSFDVSKLIIATAVISQLVTKEGVEWKAVAFGVVSGIFFFAGGLFFDRKGDARE